MDSFEVKTFDAKGQLRTDVQGDAARHYPDNEWLEVDNIQVRSINAQGRVTTASAKRGLSNGDSSQVQLIGQARVVREAQTPVNAHSAPRMEYRGELLHAFMDTEKIRSPQPVELLHGNDRFTADTLDFDNVDQVLNLRGRVHGTLMPKP